MTVVVSAMSMLLHVDLGAGFVLAELRNQQEQKMHRASKILLRYRCSL